MLKSCGQNFVDNLLNWPAGMLYILGVVGNFKHSKKNNEFDLPPGSVAKTRIYC